MSDDIIEEALRENKLNQEREATGTVNGRQIRVTKESYQTRMQRTLWKVAVYLDGNETHDNQETRLDAQKAEMKFNHLVDKHDLLSEEEEQDDSNIGRIIDFENCEECGGKLKQVSDVTEGFGSFASSFEAECTECGNEQHVPAW